MFENKGLVVLAGLLLLCAIGWAFLYFGRRKANKRLREIELTPEDKKNPDLPVVVAPREAPPAQATPKLAAVAPTSSPKYTAPHDPEQNIRAMAMLTQKNEVAKLEKWDWTSPLIPMISLVWRKAIGGTPVRIPHLGNTGAASGWLGAITGFSRYVTKVEAFNPQDKSMVEDWLSFLMLLNEGGDKAKPWVHGGASYHLYYMAYMLATGQDPTSFGDGTMSELPKDTLPVNMDFSDLAAGHDLSTEQFDEPEVVSDPPAEAPSSVIVVDLFDDKNFGPTADHTDPLAEASPAIPKIAEPKPAEVPRPNRPTLAWGSTSAPNGTKPGGEGT